MVRSVVGKVMWVGRATVFMVGLGVILALVFGAASAAFGGNGDPWILGQGNVATAITSLGGATGVDGGPMLRITNNNPGTDDTALSLNVGRGEAPMTVNSATKVTNLNADRLDDKHLTQIGVNGLKSVSALSSENSNSPKTVIAHCPSGTQALGGGYDMVGGKTGTDPNQQTNVVVDDLVIAPDKVTVVAFEEEPTSASWDVEVIARCAKAP